MFKTVKARVTLLTVAFAAIATSLVFVLGFNLVGTYQRRFAFQAVVNNMRMAAQNINNDLINISLLAYKCSEAGGDLSRYLVSEYDVMKASEMIDDLSDACISNRAGRYIDLLIVTNASNPDSILYTGTQRANAFTSPKTTEEYLKRFPLMSGFHVYGASDSIFFSNGLITLNMAAPIYAPNNKTIAGEIYFAVNPNIIRDKLTLVADSSDALFFLNLYDEVYAVGDNLEQVDSYGEFKEEKAEYLTTDDFYKPITVGSIRLSTGEVMNGVTCDIRSNISLTLAFPLERIDVGTPFAIMIFLVCALIVLLACCVVLVMNRTVVVPINKIHRAITSVSQGDFTVFPDIESDNEIGEVGRGVNRMTLSVSELLSARLADERERRDLEYRMLQNQINPHFIYNTLNTIRWMAKLQKAEGISEMSEALSRLLRTVSKDSRRVAPLKDELTLLSDYCVILRYRYGNSVEFDTNVEDEDLMECLLPRFVLQPLVENAVFHGIEPRGYGRVTVTISRQENGVSLAVRDDGVGMNKDTMDDFRSDCACSSIGLRNVHKRVTELFGEPYGLTITSEPDSFTQVVILVPFTIKNDGGI